MRIKRFAIVIVILVGFAVLAATTYDAFRWRSFLGRVRSIQVGDTKEQVLATMGQATGVFTPPQEITARILGLGVRVETWAYGKHFDWRHCFHLKFPYFWPLRFRMFRPEADDIKIEFDWAGRVSRISVPQTQRTDAWPSLAGDAWDNTNSGEFVRGTDSLILRRSRRACPELVEGIRAPSGRFLFFPAQILHSATLRSG